MLLTWLCGEILQRKNGWRTRSKKRMQQFKKNRNVSENGEDLAEIPDKIAHLVNTITGIAKQTNLVALNVFY